MNRLRIGVMINDSHQPAWVAAMLNELLSSDIAEICLMIRKALEPCAEQTFARKLISKRTNLAYLLYMRMDRKLFQPKRDAFAPVDIGARFANCPTIEVTPIRKKFSERFPAEAVEQIRSHNLDVILRLGFGILQYRGRPARLLGGDGRQLRNRGSVAATPRGVGSRYAAGAGPVPDTTVVGHL